VLLALAMTALTALPGEVQVEGLRWQLLDAASGHSWAVGDEAARLGRGGVLQAEPSGSGLALRVQYLPRGDGATELRVRVADRSGADRGLILRLTLGLPGKAEEWLGWRDLDLAQSLSEGQVSNLAGLRGLPGLPFFTEGAERPQFGRYSVYPLGAVSRGDEWLALARRIGDPLVARFLAQGGRSPVLTAEVDFALSHYTTPPREVEFSLWLLRGRGSDAGMRAALQRYYSLWPDDWQVRVDRFGGWMPFTSLDQIPNVDEFGFAYQEGARNPPFHDKLGALSFVYFHCAGEFANVPGYERGTKPLPPYEQVVAAFNAVAARRTGIENVWDLCGIRGPGGKIGYRPEKTYGDFFCQACVDPDLPYGKAMMEKLVSQVKKTPFPEGIDGVYYDGIAVGLDYAPEHLKVANHPLLWDGRLKKVLNYNLFSSIEWARAIHEAFAGTGKLTMLNDGSLSSFPFIIPEIDVPGGEMSINLQRSQARRIRAYTHHKPFCTLVKADFSRYTSAHIETYMRRCLAYGILFGFFDISPSGAHPGSSYWVHPEWYDRDRPLFRRYMPLARELARAGWEPVCEVSLSGAAGTSAPGTYVERFGPARNGLLYLTVSTDPGAQPVQEREVYVHLLGEAATRTRSGLAVELLTGQILRAPQTLVSKLRGDDLAVWALGTKQAQAEACLARARDLLAARKRYLEACASRGLELSPWRPYGDGGAKIVRPGRKGGACVMAEVTQKGKSAGATQSFTLNQKKPEPLVISAWSKAEGVTGDKDRDYALYVDCYYTDGSALYGQTVSFSTGTHDWEYGERVLQPAKPVKLVNVYLLLRGKHTGRVWFDDIRVARKAAPDENLLKRPGFETANSLRPLTDEQKAGGINTDLDKLAQQLNRPARAVGYEAAYALLRRVEHAARAGDLGADGERTLRDVADLRWHLRLAQACLAGKAQPPQRSSRITGPVALAAARRAKPGKRQYTATAGRVPRGTKVSVDSLYSGYSALPLTDGKVNPSLPDWSKVAWASADDAGVPHWIQLDLPRPQTVRKVKVWWARDAGKLWVSRKVLLQAMQGTRAVQIEGQKTSVDQARGVTTIEIPPQKLQHLRLYQPPGQGPSARPGIMWVTEIAVE